MSPIATMARNGFHTEKLTTLIDQPCIVQAMSQGSRARLALGERLHGALLVDDDERVHVRKAGRQPNTCSACTHMRGEMQLMTLATAGGA